MKEKLYQYYGFIVNYLVYKKDYVCFESNNTEYLIYKTTLDEINLSFLDDIINYLDNHSIFFHQIIKHKIGYTFEFSNQKYVVLRPRIVSERKITLEEILKTSSIPIRNNNQNLLENKIDFLEQYLANYENVQLINFNYFIGLAENSISLFNLRNDNDRKYINHHRIYHDETAFEFYNPLNIVIDYRTRDLAEYAKSLFIYGKDYILEYLKYLKLEDWYTYFARILFPSIYFDYIDKYINNNIKLEEKRISEIANSFEKKLKELYTYISAYTKIPYIEWLSDVDYL